MTTFDHSYLADLFSDIFDKEVARKEGQGKEEPDEAATTKNMVKRSPLLPLP